jgi:hypothetical protein
VIINVKPGVALDTMRNFNNLESPENLNCVSAFNLPTALPDGLFRTKNPNLGKFWRALERKMLVYFMVIWNILLSFGILYGHLVMLW